MIAISLLLAFTIIATSESLELFVPAYFDPPSEDWNALSTAASQVRMTIIINPEDGPGKRFQADYETALAQVRVNGARVLGYVPSGIAKRPIASVLNDVQTYKSFYTIDGIFVDEMSESKKEQDYYVTLYEAIKNISNTYTVVGNPGTTVPRQFFVGGKVADQIIVFEDNFDDYLNYKPAAYEAQLPKTNFGNIVYATPAAGLNTVINKAKTNVASVFISDLKLPNPYGALPSYWKQLVKAVASV